MLGVILIENMLHYEILCICVRMKKLGKAISDEVEQGFLNEWIIFTGKYQGLRPMTFQNIVAHSNGNLFRKVYI